MLSIYFMISSFVNFHLPFLQPGGAFLAGFSVRDILTLGRFRFVMRRVAVEQAGGDWARLLADLDKHRAAIDAHLARNAAQAQALGLEGTPGYLVGSILIRGAIDEGAFRRAFAQARAEGKP